MSKKAFFCILLNKFLQKKKMLSENAINKNRRTHYNLSAALSSAILDLDVYYCWCLLAYWCIDFACCYYCYYSALDGH